MQPAWMALPSWTSCEVSLVGSPYISMMVFSEPQLGHSGFMCRYRLTRLMLCWWYVLISSFVIMDEAFFFTVIV